MSARQAFIPRSQTDTPSSELHPNINAANASTGGGQVRPVHPFERPPAAAETDARETLVTSHAKARSISAFLGRKKNTTSPTVHESPAPGTRTGTGTPGLGQSVRRSFDGVRRPEMTPISIIPYPSGQPNTPSGKKLQGPGPGQTPRKTIGPGGFAFARPGTPSMVTPTLRAGKKGFGGFEEGRLGDEGMDMGANTNANAGGIVFMGPGGEMETRVGAGSGIAGYMRMLSGSESFGSGTQGPGSVGHGPDIAAPIPGYALGDLGANREDEDSVMDAMYAHSSRSLDTITEADAEMSMEGRSEQPRALRRAKHAIRHEDFEGNGRYAGEDIQSKGSAKRMRHTQEDTDEYVRISSPHAPPTPAPPRSHGVDASVSLESLFDNIGEFISPEEFEAECKRWTNCTREEWLKGADELIKEYTEILDMVKDHLTEKVMSFAKMMDTVEEKQTGLNNDTETLSEGMGIVTENISKLGKKK